MVVLAASILTKTGKVLVSRQYMDMSRVRIEGLLAAFPKLVGTGKQHTFVETENVRYIYQPLEGLYLLVITNKQSNILEDLDTLRLLSKCVPEFVTGLDEDLINKAAFDLIFAFDEVISLGHKENITVLQVKQNCEMESHEEKLHKMIIQSKINDTKDVMKRKAVEIEKTKLEQRIGVEKNRLQQQLGSLGLSGFGGGKIAAVDVEPVQSYNRPETSSFASAPKATNKGPSKGMQLGKAKKANDFLESLAKEGEVVELDTSVKPALAAAVAAASSEPVVIAIEEKLAVSLDKQGGLESFEIQGTMSLVVRTEEDAYVKVNISSGANKGFQFKTHPNIDKNMFANDNVLGLKDPSRPFPTGSELGILKWRFQSKDENLVPLTISCWPSVSGGESYVNMEYESTAKIDLRNVTISIPVPHVSSAPTINQIDGEWRYDSRRSALVWTIDLIDDSNRNGSMEFVVPATDADTFYPIEVHFTSAKTFCEVTVDTVLHSSKGSPVRYSCSRLLETSEYVVV